MRLVSVLVCLFFAVGILAGCSTVQKSAGVGAATGAGIGAIIGHQSGNAGEGALIGGAAGALAGALIGDAQEQNQTITKFCPKCGRRFSEDDMIYCPFDGAELKVSEE